MTNEPTTDSAQETRQLTAKLFNKLRLVMGALGSLKKEGFNDHHKYSYVRDQDVKDAVRQAMFDNNLMWFPSCTRVEQEGNHTASTFIVTLVDTETGHTFEFPWFGEANDTQDKGFGKSSTLGFKYLWLTMLLIGVEDDPDGSAPVERGSGPKRQTGGQTFTGKVLDKPGDYVPTFTRYKGKKLSDIVEENKGFPSWVIEKITPDDQNRADLLANCKAFVGMVDSPSPQQPAQGGQHWTETQDWQAFYIAASGLGLSNADVHAALKVESAKNYTGTKGEAWNALVEFATETVIGWHNKSELLKEWFKFLNSMPQAKRPSPAAAVKLVVGDGGNLSEFKETLAVAMNIVAGKLEL